MYGNLFVNTQISTNLRNKLQEYTQSPDKITQKYERIHSFTKRTVRSFRKFEVRVFSFLDDILSKYESIFTKLSMCIDIVEIWFEIANRQIS